MTTVREIRSSQLGLDFSSLAPPTSPTTTRGSKTSANLDELEDCAWSASVALDPKHRPQHLADLASTVRREWRRYPQEAHLLDAQRRRYRRLSLQEIIAIQGFPADWFADAEIRKGDKIRAIGDAVPPPVACAVIRALDRHVSWQSRTAVEVCAGAGGLASGSAAAGFEHHVLIDHWAPACAVLRSGKPWPADRVVCGSISDYDFTPLRGSVGLLSGGPPCQPWSQAGRRAGHGDPRDLLGRIHELVASVEPEAFVFENVPGLMSEENEGYLSAILARLRAPGTHIRYGVVSGILNAADYGVPQFRRRVFIIGLRDEPSATAFRVLDTAAAEATHRDPALPGEPRRPWVTLREAFASIPDPRGWRHWPF